MNYISAAEFLKQPEKVRKSLIEWWQPKFGDLATFEGIDYHYSNYTREDDYCFVTRYSKEDEKDSYEDIYGIDIQNMFNVREVYHSFKSKFDVIPLFTEGQLRNFIEEKTGCKVEVVYVSKDLVENEQSYYRIDRSCFKDGKVNCWKAETDDLLQAYWQVACKISAE